MREMEMRGKRRSKVRGQRRKGETAQEGRREEGTGENRMGRKCGRDLKA